MGGFGSGGHNKQLMRAEHFRKLDAASLQRAGLFRDGQRATVSWKNDNQTETTIAVIGGRDRIELEYKGKPADGEVWTDYRDAFRVTWSPRHFGGEQAYLSCYNCEKSARFLYLAYFRFRCRKCHGLVHASSQERPGERASRKSLKLRLRIGAPLGLGDIVIRPKGMHTATYEKYLARIEDAEQDVWDDAARFLKRLHGKDAAFLSDLQSRSFFS